MSRRRSLCRRARGEPANPALSAAREHSAPNPPIAGIVPQMLSGRQSSGGQRTPIMLLTITTTHQPATDLGYLLHKNPARPQHFDLTFGRAHVIYPVADADRCMAALLLEVDPVQLVRGKSGRGERFAIDHYVNDRPYVASSLLSVAISQVFGTALSGRCREKPELAAAHLPLVARMSALRCRGGETLLR